MVFLFILMSQCAALYYIHFVPYERTPIDVSAFNAQFNRMIANATIDSIARGNYFRKDSNHFVVKSPSVLFAFDPNSLEKEGWEKFGLSSKQSATIVHFVSKGGKFRMKEDLKKVYGMKKSDYNRLEAYINLPDSTTYFSAKQTQKAKKKDVLRVDLAKADSLDILKLPGIGPGFTHRILAYRNKLGGFCSLDQLHEVWGFTDSLFQAIAPNIFLSDTIPFKPLLVNTLSWDELKVHPYLGYKLARILVNYRDQHGAFQSLADFRSVPLITEENFRKLAPYLKFKD